MRVEGYSSHFVCQSVCHFLILENSGVGTGGGQGGPCPPHFLTQTRLNSTMILSVHKEYTDQLDLVDIGNEFVRESHHRENVFGIFEIRYYFEFNLCAICQLLWVWLLGVA